MCFLKIRKDATGRPPPQPFIPAGTESSLAADTLFALFTLAGGLRSRARTRTNSLIPVRAAVMYEGNETGGSGRLANTVAVAR